MTAVINFEVEKKWDKNGCLNLPEFYFLASLENYTVNYC
ncbi:hypothetical protein ADICYQ_4555 [Cyclobacterium qasimii M12-11B]|uniref:Uncharacterized protein n=1 Tax=Cyclobacterium qasimii M12-11B TaxID=641524 RepID=S7V929_9BACT|nr:hypothetical protein ADICYQ_4555 [Cyclobacterium qasimii M12-11B]